MTPALGAGIIERVWSLVEVVALLDKGFPPWHDAFAQSEVQQQEIEMNDVMWIIVALLIAIAIILGKCLIEISSNVEAILRELKDIREAVRETTAKSS